MKILLMTAMAMLISFPGGLTHADDSMDAAGTNTNVDRSATQNYREVNAATADYGDDPIDVEDFVEEATAKGIAEIETAKLTLKKGSPYLHDFANKMIEDHTKANRKLAEIASQQGLETADDATLMDQAKAMILKVRDEESFDEAYVNNQIMAHEQTIELFRRGAKSDNKAISQFASETLPKLEKHLKRAKELKTNTGAKGS